ncbi:MAG: Ig-like domain-containing protein [Candidatus Auribacterota bacterium]|nr:Ig-like domain-containing protein [Candidatus Auribacterota bacterium]
MSVHPNKVVCGGLLFVVLIGLILFPPVSLQIPAYADVPLKEMESLGTRLRHRTISMDTNRVTKKTKCNISVVNLSHDPVYPPIRLVIDSISAPSVTLSSPDGSMNGKPYIEISEASLAGGVLDPGEEHPLLLTFDNPGEVKFSYAVSFYGHMALKELTFAAVGTTPRLMVNSNISVRIISIRVDRARGGVEYRVSLRNTGNEDIFCPIRIVVDSITNPAVALADNYGVMDGFPYVVVEDEIADGVLSPGEESDPIWLYFSDPPLAKFGFTSKTHGFKAYYYDVTSQLNVLLEDLGVVTGVNTFSVNISNTTLSAINGPVRMKITGMTVAGVPFTGDIASLVSSKSGVVAGIPYQIIVPGQNQIGAGQSTSVNMLVGNTSGEPLGFTLEFEALYHPLDVLTGVSVNLGSPVNNAGAGTTAITATLLNTGSQAVVSPMMLILDSVNISTVELQGISGYIHGKPFIEVDIPQGMLYSQESQEVQLVFANPQQAAFTPVMVVQGVQSVAVADNQPPVSQYVYAYHDQWVNQNEVAVSLSATDDVSGVKAIYYRINGGAIQEYTGLLVFSISAVARTITFWAEDNAGNVESPAKQVIVKLDKDAPHTSYVFPGEGTWLTQNTTISLTADDLFIGNELSGVLNINYKVGDAGTVQTVAGTSVQVSITAEGQYPVYFWAVDNAGNIEQQQTVMVWMDKTAPITGFTYAAAGQWTNQPANIQLTAQDAVSGVAVIHYTINGVEYTGSNIQISESGEYDVTCWSVDVAGNVETPAHQISVKIDNQSPNVAHNFTATGQWLTADTIVTITADDIYQGASLTGVQSVSYKIGDAGTVQTIAGASAQVSVTAEGQYPVYFWAIDNAGNESAHGSFVVWMDKTAPTTSFSYPYDGQWTSQPANIQLIAEDAVSGIAAIYYTIDGNQFTGNLIQISSPGDYAVTCWSVDNAGNVETPVHQFNVKIDDQLPTVNHNFQYSAQWITADTLVTLTASSGNVPILNIQYKIGETGTVETVSGSTAQVQISQEGQYPVYFWANNTEGASSAQNNFIVWMDKTAPITGFTYAAAGQWTNQPANIQLTAQDAFSGVAVIHYTINGVEYTGSNIQISESGEYDVTCWSVDVAGNVETPAHQISVKIDSQSPNVAHNFNATGQWLTANTVVTVTADDLYQGMELSGVQSVSYKIGDAGTVQTIAGASAQVSVNVEGQYPVYFWAVDNVGNESAHGSFVVWMDKTAPVTTAVYANNGIWVTEDASISLTAEDSVSGVSQTYYSINGAESVYTGSPITITQAGEYFVNYWSVDNAGNIESKYANQVIVRIDRTAPTTTTSSDAINNVWVNYPVNITLIPNDPEGNLAQTYFIVNGGATQTGTQVNIPNDGIHTVQYWSADTLNNTEAEKSLTIKIDTKKPVTTDNYDGTVIGDVTITLTATDENGSIPVSGLKATRYTINGGSTVTGTSIFLPGTGMYNVQYWSEDNAGNIENKHTLNIAFTTAPVLFITTPVNGFTTTGETVNIFGEIDNDSPVTITCNNVAGTVTGNQFQILGLPLQEGQVYYSVEAENVAGLKTTRYVLIIKDTTAPVVTITSPANGTTLAATTVNITGSVQETNATYYLEKSSGPDQQLTIQSDGTFTIASYPIVEGTNILSFYGIDALGNNGKTKGTQTKITIISDLTPPTMTLQVALYDAQTDLPRAPQTVNGADVTYYNQVGKLDISGQVGEATATVRINGIDVPVQADGTFSRTGITMALAEGQEGLVTIGARDAVQNLNRVYVRIIKDTIGPEIFVTSFTDGQITNDPAPKTVTGVARGTTQVTVNGQTVAVADERFTFNNWAIAQGVNTLSVSGSDSIGNITSISRNLILDSIAPDAPILLTPSVQTFYSNQDRVSIHGTAEPNSVVMFTGGALNVEENAGVGGLFTRNVFLNTNTTNNIQVRQRDVAGNISAPASLIVIHDNRRPVLQVSSPTYSITDSFQVLVSANVSDDVALTDSIKIEVSSNGSIVNTFNAPIVNGVATTMVNLGDGNYGQYTLIITVSDRSGNTRVVNLPMQYIEPTDDTEGPEIVITVPQNNTFINTPNLVIQGSCVDRSGVSEFKISIDGVDYTDIPPENYDNEGMGSFSYTVSLGSDGLHTISLMARDMTLNNNQSIVNLQVTLDTVPPLTAPTVSGITPGIQTGDDVFLTNNSNIRVIGSYEPGFTVTAQSSIETKSATVSATGIYQVDIKISSSTQQNIEDVITLVGFDKAGNASTQINPDLKKVITVVYDGIKPTVTNVVPVDGSINVGLNETITVTFSEAIQAESLGGNQGNRIYVTDSQNVRYEGVLTVVAGTEGKVALYTLTEDLSFADSEQLTITIDENIKDMAGNNLQTTYTTVFYTVDETPPAVPQITSISPGTIINVPSINVAVKTDPDTNVIVYYADNDTPVALPFYSSGSQINIEIFVIENVVNNFMLRARDMAGNESSTSTVITVTHDSIRPSILTISPDETDTTPLPYNAIFQVEFDERISQDTLGAVSLASNSGPIVATYTLVANSSGVPNATVRIVPTNLLSDGAVVTLTITEDIKDIAGNSPDFSAEPDGVKKVVYNVQDNVPPAVPVITALSEQSPTTALEVVVTGTTEPGADILVNGGAISGTLVLASNSDTGEFSVTVPLQSDKNNVITIRSRDKAGNTSGSVTRSIFSDQKAPSLLSIMPSEGSAIPASGVFTLVFSEAIKQSTLSAIVIMQQTTPVSSTTSVNEDGNIVNITSSNPLDTTMPHSLVIGTGVTDEAGNHFAAERVVVYQTNDPIVPSKPILTSATENSPTTATEVTVSGYGENFTQITTVQAVKLGGGVVAEVLAGADSLFNITIPLETNKLNSFRIRGKRPSGNLGQPVDFSIVQDIAGPQITILAPSAGVVLPSDSVTLVANIKDASTLSSCKVNGVEKILNVDKNGYLNTIVENITDQMLLTIEASDVVNNKSTESIQLSVNIEDPATEMNPPVISIIYPTQGMHFDGQSISVMGTVEDANDISMITVDGTKVTTPSTFPTASAYYTSTAKLVDGANVITVNAWDINNNMGTATVTIDVDIAPPSITITSPQFEGIFTESNVTISGLVTDSNGILEFTMDDIPVAYDESGHFSANLNISVGANKIQFKATDVAGNITELEWIVYYDVIGPVVQSISPADGETGVPFSAVVHIQFDERLAPETVSTDTVKLVYLDDIGDEIKELTGNVTLDRDVVVFSPNTLLAPGATYRVKILNGITDLIGFPLQSPISTVFTVDTQITMLCGMVIDPDTGEGIYNANVSIIGTGISMKTDKLGNFNIRRATIPAGLQLIHVDGSTAIHNDNIVFAENRFEHMILTNQINNVNKAIYLPRLNPLSTEYVNGLTEQVITFNDTITGAFDDAPIPDRFSMTVPAGALEFPNGSTSGAISASIVHEMFLPNPEVSPAFSVPVVTAVWFHPFGIKCNEPVKVSLPFPSDRGETGINPGDRFMIISYNSETCKWEDVGYGHANDDVTVLEMAEGFGLTELTIVAMLPIAISQPLENELRVMHKKYYGGQGEDQFIGLLLELMVAISIMAMMTPLSIVGWSVQQAKPGTQQDRIYYSGAMCKVSNEWRAKPSGYEGRVFSHQYYPLFPSLIWLMVCMALNYPVNCTVDVEWVSSRTGSSGIRNLPVCSYTLEHSAFNTSFHTVRNPFPLIIDVWGYSGDIRFIGDDGNPTPNPPTAPATSPWIGVYSDAQQFDGGASGIVDGDPVASTRLIYGPLDSTSGLWWKSYSGATIKSNMWAVGRRQPIYGADGGVVNQTWRSYIYPGKDIRVLCKAGDNYVGDNYTVAPYPQVSTTTGNITNVNMYCNVTIGKLNVDCYISRQYITTTTTGTLISEQILPYQGIASTCDTKLVLYTGMTLANGKTAPAGNYDLQGQISYPGGTTNLNVKPGGGTPWVAVGHPQPGTYTVKVSSNGNWGESDLLYINLKSKQQAPEATPPVVERPQARTGGRGVYTAPTGTQEGDSRRVTPAPAADTDRKEYTIVVVEPIMFSSCGAGSCDAKAYYVNFSQFHQSGDPNMLASLPVNPEDIFNVAEPKITIDHYKKVATKVEIKLNSRSLITGAEAKPGILFRLTQVGLPYVLTRKLPANFVTRTPMDPDGGASPEWAVYSTGVVTAIYPDFAPKPSMFTLDTKVSGVTIVLDIVPPPPAYAGDLTNITRYFDFLEAEREAIFQKRYWLIEIIDRNTMLNTESSGVNYQDSVYNLIEKVIIYVE